MVGIPKKGVLNHVWFLGSTAVVFPKGTPAMQNRPQVRIGMMRTEVQTAQDPLLSVPKKPEQNFPRGKSERSKALGRGTGNDWKCLMYVKICAKQCE